MARILKVGGGGIWSGKLDRGGGNKGLFVSVWRRMGMWTGHSHQVGGKGGTKEGKGCLVIWRWCRQKCRGAD